MKKKNGVRRLMDDIATGGLHIRESSHSIMPVNRRLMMKGRRFSIEKEGSRNNSPMGEKHRAVYLYTRIV